MGVVSVINLFGRLGLGVDLLGLRDSFAVDGACGRFICSFRGLGVGVKGSLFYGVVKFNIGL